MLYFDDIVEDVTQSSASSSVTSSAKETAQWLCSPSVSLPHVFHFIFFFLCDIK